MSTARSQRPVVLCILDGWGSRAEATDNAIRQARTPVWDRLSATCPSALLQASESHVGLPDGQMGNSEVGHMNLGAGRVVTPDLPRIDRAMNMPDVTRGALADDPTLARFAAAVRAAGGVAHLAGLVSPGGVHSHQDHMVGLARLLDRAGLRVVIHAFLDGRDTPPSSARGFLESFRAVLPPSAAIGTLGGRWFAMDRDQRWERVARAYASMVDGEGARAADVAFALDEASARGETDEFTTPTALGDFAGMRDGDGLLMANFRADRAREILSALLDPTFDGFTRRRRPAFAASLGMVSYSQALDRLMPAMFPPIVIDQTLGEVVASAGMRQLRVAETEKYAHVTFFLNGGEERVFAGEDRIMVPSPKVATYDLQPAMAADEVTDRLVATIAEARHDLIVVNYANTDMVGHTGVLTAAIEAVEAVDRCLGRLEAAVLARGGKLLITADHGNAEEMRDATTGEAHTQHTLNPVPVLLVGDRAGRRLVDGRLADVAPTLLDLLGLPRPAAMTGRSLIRPATSAEAAN
jgi:2,3-bisphosphoglycerate-independent phosphoglycerate mutase